MLLWYEGNSRYRCSGSLIEPNLVLTAGHCTEAPKGKTLVLFDQQPDLLLPRAADHNPATGASATGYPTSGGFINPGDPMPTGMVNPNGATTSQWHMFTGTAVTHPKYSNFTDLANWNDVGVIKLDAAAPYAPMKVAPLNMLNAYAQPTLNKTLFRSIGYGTHIQKPDNGPQKPVAEANPIERQYADQPGQKLTRRSCR